MPENEKQQPDYISTVYSSLKNHYGDDFNKTEDDFRNKISSDYEYRKTAYSFLKNAYGDGFKKDFNSFNFKLPSIESPNKPEGQTTIEDFDRAKTELPKLANQNQNFDYSLSKATSSMPSETTQSVGGVYRAVKSEYDKLQAWGQKQQEQTSKEKMLAKDPEIMHSDMQLNSEVAAKLFHNKALGPDATNYAQYLIDLKDDNPEKYQEVFEKISDYGTSLDDKERYDMIQDGLNYRAKKISNDRSILQARGHELRFTEYSKLAGKMNQIAREANSYGEAIPEDRREILKSKYDALSQQMESFESDEVNQSALENMSGVLDEYDSIIQAQNKLIKDSPSILKNIENQKDIKRQEEIIEGGFNGVKKGEGETFKKATQYAGKEIVGNIWNTALDAATGIIETAKDLTDWTEGYSGADRFVDKVKSLTDSSLKATISETDLFDDKGNMRMYRFLPNLGKVATDMAIMLAPVGRLRQLGEAAKFGKYADEAAVVSSQFITTYDDYKNTGVASGMSEGDAKAYGLAASFATSLAASLSPNTILTNPGTMKAGITELAERYAKQGITGLTKKEAFNKLVGEVIEITGTSLKEGAKEVAQENAESIIEKAINIGFNAKNKNNPSITSLEENLTSDEIKMNTIFALATAAPATSISMSINSQDMNDSATLELLKNYDDSIRVLNEMKDSGKLSDDAFNRVTGQLESTKELYDKIPSKFSDTSKHNLIPLLREKAGLEERVKKLDKTFVVQDNKRLEDINKTLQAFYEKETGIESTSEGTEKTPTKNGKEEKVIQEEFEPLSDNEVSGLKNGSEVLILEEGKPQKAIVSSVMNNGEILLEIGSRKKIVLDNSLVKKVEPIEGEKLDLTEDEINELKSQDEATEKQQKESPEKPGTQAWNLAVKNRLGKVFKGSEVSFNQEEFDAAAQASAHPDAINSNAFYDPKTNKIFINPKKVKKDTPIHEFTHIWSDVLKEKNNPAYERMLEISKQSEFYKQTKNNPAYSHLSDNDIAEEAFVQAVGKKGVDVFNDIADRNKFQQAMVDLWDYLKNALGLGEFNIDADTSFTDLVNMAAKDVAKNKPVKIGTRKDEVKQQNIFNDAVEDISSITEKYAEKAGIKDYKKSQKINAIDEENSKRIADAYSEMKHDPKNKDVKEAYEAMAKETVDQYQTLSENGYSFEIFEGNGEPYKNSKEMLQDLKDNKHLYILSTEKDFGNAKITDEQREENPLLRDSGIKDKGGKPLLVNDIFRGVHDAIGHGELGNSFGAVGEENAWNVHSKMYSEKARRAMTSETRGQNSFVNFGPHMRNKEGKILKNGEEGYLDAKSRPFAEQKIGLLPDWIVQNKKYYESALTPEEKSIQDKMQKDFTENYEERKAEYIKKNGLVFDTDRAREFSPEYNKNPELLSNSTQIPAREFVNKIYKEELAKDAPEGKTNTVVFTAGGSGVGKSRAIEKLDLNNHITVDTNLSNFERAVDDIQEALDNKKAVNIFFTYRDPVQAFTSKLGGVIERAKKAGRTVPFNVATSINEKALKTIIKLSEHFNGNELVNFNYFNNSFKRGEAKPITLEDVKKIKVDYDKAKEEIKNEIERQHKSGELEKGSKFPVESLYSGLIGDTKRLQELIGTSGMEQKSPGSLPGGSKFQFDPESGSGRKVREYVKRKLEEGISEDKIRTYLKKLTGVSDKMLGDIMKSAKSKPAVQKKETFTNTEQGQKSEQNQEKQVENTEKQVAETVRNSVEVNDKIVALDRVPVEDRLRTVLGRVFNNPETPQTLVEALTKRFGSREAMLKSKRYSQKEARELGKSIVDAFDNLSDAIDFSRGKGYEIDGDIQAAVLDNVVSDAYEAEKKSTNESDREYYKNIQSKALDEIASIGEQSGRRISYYNLMYNVNPVIFGEKEFQNLQNFNQKVIEKKIGDSALSANEKIDQFARDAKIVVEKAKKDASLSKKLNEILEGFSMPKYQGPKTNKTPDQIKKIRDSRNEKMAEIKKSLGKKQDPGEKFSFDKPESVKIDDKKLVAVKEIGETFVDEGFLTYNQWSRKVKNTFKDAGIDVYSKELQAAWDQLSGKVETSLKSAYKDMTANELKGLIASQAASKVKEQTQAIRDILSDITVSTDMKDKIKKRLMDELGLSEGYSDAITDAFNSEFENQARKQVKQRLDQVKNNALISFRKTDKVSEDKIVKDVLNGTFDGEQLKPAFYEMYGMDNVGPEVKDKLIDLARKVATQTEGSLMKDKALRDLYNEIQRHKPISSFKLGTDVYYASLLSGYETHIKNFALFNALQVYVNKPMQMAIQNMLSGNKSKSARAIYSKGLASFMYNEAKGIVLTGTNSFYDTSHSESTIETFTKDGGKNPLKKLWRYAHLPTRFLSAEDAFGTIGLSEVKARQILYNKIKSDLQSKGEQVIPDQINSEVNKALGYTKESYKSALISARQSLSNYYGDQFNLKEELTKKPQTKDEYTRQQKIRTEYTREVYRSIVTNRNAEVTDQAVNWAKTALLQNDPEGTLGRVYVGMQGLINQIPVLRLFMPFIKVPLNVTNNIIQSTPGTSYIRLITGKKGTFDGQKMSKDEYKEHLQRSITYTAMIAGLAALQEGLRDDDENPFFYVTGKNGKSYSDASAREVAGIDQPYTVYVGGVPILKYQYTPWMPLFAGLGIWNDIRLENNGEIPEGKEASDLAANVFIKYANTINEQAALKGVNEVFNLVQDGYDSFIKGNGGWDHKLKEFAGKKAASTVKTLLIPNIATQANTDIKALFDMDRIATTSYMDDIIKDMPIVDVVSQQFGNESKIDVLGRPIKEKFSVAGYGKVGDDEFYKLFVDKHYLPFAYNKSNIKVHNIDDSGEVKVTEIPLSLEEKYTANLVRGRMLHEYMKEHVNELKEMDDDSFQSTLKSVIKSFDQQVEAQMFEAEDYQE